MTSVAVPLTKKIKTGGTRGPKPASAGSIAQGEIYTLGDFKLRTGWGDGALRSARRKGLRVFKEGNIGFVRGKDFHAYLAKIAGESQDCQ